MIAHYRYIYWHEGLRCPDPQQLLFAIFTA